MRYVDEYRSAELARGLAAEIASLVDAGRDGADHGGLRRPHARDLPPRARGSAPARGRARARARLPGVRDPDGPRRRRDRARRGQRASRSRRSATCCACPAGAARCSRRRRAAPTCAWSTRRSTRSRSPRSEPERRVVFFAIGFETTAPATAVTLLRARARGDAELRRLLQPRRDRAAAARDPRDAGPARRRVHRPGPRLDGDRDRRATASSPRSTAGPIVVSAFEPVDLLQSIAMLLRQRAEGRCEVENQYTRVVRPEGNARALAAIDETMELREDFEWRGLGALPRSALRLRRRVRGLGRRGAVRAAGRADRGPEGVPLRRGADGADQAVGVRRLRHRLHARAAARHVHGLERGRVRRVLRLRPPAAAARRSRLAREARRCCGTS